MYFKDKKGKAEYLVLSRKGEPSFLCPELPCGSSIYNTTWDTSNIKYGSVGSWLRRERAEKNIH